MFHLNSELKNKVEKGAAKVNFFFFLSFYKSTFGSSDLTFLINHLYKKRKQYKKVCLGDREEEKESESNNAQLKRKIKERNNK